MNNLIVQLETVFSDIILNKDLSSALKNIKDFLAYRGITHYDDRLEEVESGYNLMKDYMSRGYKDEMRESLYFDMLRKLYTVAFDSSKNIQIANGQYYSTAAENSSKINLNEEAISEKFEGYIQDMAMISLQPDSSQRELEEKIISTFSLQIINEYDVLSKRRIAADTIKPNKYMATR